MKTCIQNLHRATSRGALLLLCGLATTAVHAQIIGNLPQTNDGFGTSFGSIGAKAMVFTMGSSAYDVTSVLLRLNGYNTSVGDIATLGFFLDNGSETDTGAQVGNFLTAPASASNAPGTFTFTPSGSLTLAANTKYWMRLSSPTGGFSWTNSVPGITPTGVGATFNSAKFTPDNIIPYANSGALNSFQINGTALTPELPGSALLVPALLPVALMAIRRRRLGKASV